MKAKYAAIFMFVGVCSLTFPVCHGLTANSCETDTSRVSNRNNDTVILVKSMKQLKVLPKGTFIETCDLSRQGLKYLPDLRTYSIKKLNLSGNNFWVRGFNAKKLLPKSLEILDMSNCKVLTTDRNKKGVAYVKNADALLWFDRDSFPKLREIDLHNTKLSSVRIPRCVKKADLSNCDLYQFKISGYWDKERLELRYLDISHNWNMYSGIGIEPDEINRIDTLKRDSCAKGEELWEGYWL